MEGLYHNNNNLYSSSPYMISHSDHPSYYTPPSSLPCRTNNNNGSNSAFSDARPPSCPSFVSTSSSSSHPDSLASPTTNHSSNNNTITTATAIAPGWSSPSSPANGSGYAWSNPPTSNYQHPYSYHHHHHHHHPSPRPPPYSSSTSCYALSTHTPIQRPKLTTTVWEDEGTVCYQVDAKSVCVARRQDNDMINGTKLLNVVGMSRGKRDGILKNEKGRVVVKVGAMHLKGVWITFERAKDLAAKFKITELLYPLFTDDPSVFLCPSTSNNTMLPPPTTSQPVMVPSTRPPSYQYKQDSNCGFPMWEKPTTTPAATTTTTTTTTTSNDHHDSFTNILRGGNDLPSGSCSPVPGSMAPSNDNDIYLMNNPYDCTRPSSSSTYRNHYDASPYDYDTFSRKPMIKPPSHLSTTYPHSPPHEESKSHRSPPRKRSLASAASPPPPADKRTLKRLRTLDN